MKPETEIEVARRAAIDVLLHNTREGRAGLPRTVGFGPPEPRTRELMIGSLGVLASGNEELAESLGRTLHALADRQAASGLIPGICDAVESGGDGDTTPLFLMGVAAYRASGRCPSFLDDASQKALDWCEDQRSKGWGSAARQVRSNGHGERCVLGNGPYVRTLVHAALVLFGRSGHARALRIEMNDSSDGAGTPRHAHRGLALPDLPYLALFGHERRHAPRFDLLGNSLAILSGAISNERAVAIVEWLEPLCDRMRAAGELATIGTPNLLPTFERGDQAFRRSQTRLGAPGLEENGGLWPFICGFYVAALVATGKLALAERKLVELTELCTRSREPRLKFGFNEWLRASDGCTMGQDWQFSSASMYLYASACVESGRTPFFEAVRSQACHRDEDLPPPSPRSSSRPLASE